MTARLDLHSTFCRQKTGWLFVIANWRRDSETQIRTVFWCAHILFDCNNKPFILLFSNLFAFSIVFRLYPYFWGICSLPAGPATIPWAGTWDSQYSVPLKANTRSYFSKYWSISLHILAFFCKIYNELSNLKTKNENVNI